MAKNKASSDDYLEQSPSHLLHQALRRAADIHDEICGPGALTQRQFATLAAVHTRDGATQIQLVKATGIDRSTLAELVARMITKGLLEVLRRVSPRHGVSASPGAPARRG